VSGFAAGFLGLLVRDLRLAVRRRGDASLAVLFFVLAAALFPFGVGPEPNLLARMAPGIIWVTALLAVLLSLERLFLADYEDGSLDLMILAPQSLAMTVLAKTLAHWLTTGLPLIAAAPLLALLYNMDPSGLPMLILAMALGTPTLSLTGAVGAALTLGARRGGVLIPLLVLPLNIPVLIFGVSALDATLGGFNPLPHILFLGALFLVSLVLAPIAAAAALRQATE